jgi:hypothetical protein
MNEDWKAAWQPVIDLIGQPLAENKIVWSSIPVEAGAVRRWLDPLEFDCALHYDRAAAQAHGYTNIVAPYASISGFAISPLWQPGTTLFDSAERNAQPIVRSLQPPLPPQAPAFTGYFATDMEYDFLRPVVVGEFLGRRAPRLIACAPKETKVGRGAFVTFEAETLSVADGDVVARMRFSLFCYNPHPTPATAATPKEVA